MLMDEPFGAIDPITRTRLQDELLRIQRELRKTIFVTHDIDEAILVGDRIAILREGGCWRSTTRRAPARAPSRRLRRALRRRRPGPQAAVADPARRARAGTGERGRRPLLEGHDAPGRALGDAERGCGRSSSRAATDEAHAHARPADGACGGASRSSPTSARRASVCSRTGSSARTGSGELGPGAAARAHRAHPLTAIAVGVGFVVSLRRCSRIDSATSSGRWRSPRRWSTRSRASLSSSCSSPSPG